MADMKPMLAVSAPLDKIKYPVYGSSKFDGIRCVTTAAGPKSRTLKDIPNRAVFELMKKDLSDYQLDGELIIGNPTAEDVFRTTSSGIMSHAGEPSFRYYVFDMWSLSHAEYFGRYGLLQAYYNAGLLPPYVELVEQRLLQDEEQLLAYEAEQLALGYEGVIIRSTKAPYKFGRSTLNQQYLMKRKPLEQAEGKVIGWEYLRINNNEATTNDVGYTKRSTGAAGLEVDYSRLGAITVEVLNGDFKGSVVSIGTGFTMEEREYWARHSMKGKTVTFAYQASGAKDRPRFPSFKGIRDNIDI